MALEPILKDIQRALDSGAPFAALMTSVTLPEICGRCEQNDIFPRKGKDSGDKIYKRFVETYLPNWSIGLTWKDLYILRCGLSHRGKTTRRASSLRYVFHPPNPLGIIAHGNRAYDEGGALHRLDIDLQIFCNDISGAVRRWSEANKQNKTVQKNLTDVLQVREGDFETGVYVQGMTCLA
jgi:hypothetical protein